MDPNWWRDAVIYQIYLRSFSDSNGDGIGDLAGLTARLDYVQSLGVDALWLNPCYVSPQRDHGYDIADYFNIDPSYGTVDELKQLVSEAHARGIRVLLDMVANHCSDQHLWFQQALAAEPGGPERARFLFSEGQGVAGELPPNNWQSVFGGPAWTRVPDGQWYFHAFDSSQPDFNWRNQDVVDYFDEVLKFWFGCGVDGFRIDVAHGLFKAEDLPDAVGDGHNYAMWDQPEVHAVYRRWRAIGEGFEPTKYFVGEIWVPSVESLRGYLAPDELHQAFTFDLLVQPWDASRMRGAIERALTNSEVVGGPPAWTLSNHDVHRPVTRYGQAQHLDQPLPTDMIAAARRQGPADVELGVRRAKAATMLQLALPGATYLYQGEELGLPEVLDLPETARQDPIWLRSAGSELGRDGCRVPLPWNSSGPTFGFGPDSSTTAAWLPQPAWFGRYSAESQAKSASSTLSLYREAIAARQSVFAETDTVNWLESGSPDVLVLSRGSGVCAVNFGATEFSLPDTWGTELVLASEDTGNGSVIPPNSAAWLTVIRDLPGVSDVPTDGVRMDSPAPQLEPTAP